MEPDIQKNAAFIAAANSVFFLGRTASFPVALEGAQKLREISYIHAQAYPSSELKHGPLALITRETPCIVLLPDDELLPRSLSTLEEIKTRHAPIMSITDSSDPVIRKTSDKIIVTQAVESLLKPVIFGITLQLLAYHVALLLGRDIDQPRNLAKSVTVE